MQPEVTPFFDEATFTVSYVVADPATSHCALVDTVLDFDKASGRTSTLAADQMLKFVHENELIVDWILETHAHADHLTAAPYLKSKLGGKIGIGAHIVQVQDVFNELFNLAGDAAARRDHFDHLFEDEERFAIGELEARVMHTPGHTPACVTYAIGDAAFVGDTLFMPDYGTARTDFPGGDAATLYHSIQKIFELPLSTRLFMCHDYKSPTRNVYAWETTVSEERNANVHACMGTTEAEFVSLRNGRDATLAMPNLIVPAVQVNIRAGELPPAEDNGVRYLKLPVDAL